MGREDRCFPVHNVPKNIVYFIVIYIAIDYDYEIIIDYDYEIIVDYDYETIVDYNYECHYTWNYECHYAWNYECHHIVETGPVRATGAWS